MLEELDLSIQITCLSAFPDAPKPIVCFAEYPLNDQIVCESLERLGINLRLLLLCAPSARCGR